MFSVCFETGRKERLNVARVREKSIKCKAWNFWLVKRLQLQIYLQRAHQNRLTVGVLINIALESSSKQFSLTKEQEQGIAQSWSVILCTAICYSLK